MRLDKLLYELESQKNQLPKIERVILDNSEQVKHPARFKKVLDNEEITESGCKIKMYHLERKKEQQLCD